MKFLNEMESTLKQIQVITLCWPNVSKIQLHEYTRKWHETYGIRKMKTHEIKSK